MLSPGSPSSLLCGETRSEAFSDEEPCLADFSSELLALSVSLLPVSSSGDFSGAAIYSVFTGSGSFFSCPAKDIPNQKRTSAPATFPPKERFFNFESN